MAPTPFKIKPIPLGQSLFSSRVFQAALAFCLCLQFVFFLWVGGSILIFPFGADYGEAPLMDQAQRITAGMSLYKIPLVSPPFVISNYPPIYPILVAGISQFTGAALLQTGRAISLAATVGCTGTIGWIVWKITQKRFAALAAAGLFAGNSYVTLWGSMARVDLLALMFSLLALGSCLRWQRSWLRTWLISLCLVASVYTRQTYLLAAPLACCTALWPKSKRHALGLGALFACQTLALFVLCNTASRGGFYTHIVQANVNAYEIERALLMYQQFLLIWPVTIGLMVWLGIQATTQMFLRKPGEISGETFATRVLPIYTLLTLASSLTVGKVGSNVNYFLEFVAALTIGIGLILGRSETMVRRPRGLLTLLIIQTLWGLAINWGLYRPAVQSLWASLEHSNQLYQRVQAAVTQGPVLADNHLSLTLLAGQSIYYQPFEYGQLYQAGLWDPASFAEEIRRQKFPLILIGGDTLEKPCCWPPETIAAIREQYDVMQEPGVLICTPKEK